MIGGRTLSCLPGTAGPRIAGAKLGQASDCVTFAPYLSLKRPGSGAKWEEFAPHDKRPTVCVTMAGDKDMRCGREVLQSVEAEVAHA